MASKDDPQIRLRELAPVWADAALEEDVVARCARAYAEAFRDNPASPTLAKIAEAAGCSRNAVKGNLAAAQARGLIALSVHLPKDASLSRDLEQEYGLVEAIVSPQHARWDDQESIRSVLAPEVMRYLERAAEHLDRAGLQRSFRVGIDGGLTLFQAARDAGPFAFPRLKYELHPLVFGPLGEPAFTASVVAHLLASRLLSAGATVSVKDQFSINPVWQRSPRWPHGVRFEVEMRTKTTPADLDLLFVGIGSRGAGLLQRELQAGQGPKGMPAKYAGDILNLAFDQRGSELRELTRNRTVLLTLEELRRVAKGQSAIVVGAAGGRDKFEALRVVLSQGYVSVLITDQSTARALLSTRANS